MKLSDLQFIFTKNVIDLLEYCNLLVDNRTIDKFVIGEVWRREDVIDCPKCGHNFTFQEWLYKKGWTKTKKSRHSQKLAIDLYFWISGQFVENLERNKALIEPIGTYWERINELNRWGGHYAGFLDLNHFEKMSTKKDSFNGVDS